MVSMIAQVEPLPFVPPTVITGHVETQFERVANLADARQTHIDTDRMRGFQMRKPCVEGGKADR